MQKGTQKKKRTKEEKLLGYVRRREKELKSPREEEKEIKKKKLVPVIGKMI